MQYESIQIKCNSKLASMESFGRTVLEVYSHFVIVDTKNVPCFKLNVTIHMSRSTQTQSTRAKRQVPSKF